MTVRVVGWLTRDAKGREILWSFKPASIDGSYPAVSLPTVIEALLHCTEGAYGWDHESLNKLYDHLKQLTTPADADGRVK